MKVIDLTIEELRDLIGEVVDEKFRALLSHPDHELEFREEFEDRLATSLASKERIPVYEVKKRLGLNEV